MWFFGVEDLEREGRKTVVQSYGEQGIDSAYSSFDAHAHACSSCYAFTVSYTNSCAGIIIEAEIADAQAEKAMYMGRYTFGAMLIVGAVCALIPSATYQIKPITKEQLIRSCKPGQRERKPAASYIVMLQKHGVDFSPTVEDEVDIRAACRYLGEKELAELIDAIRYQYRLQEALAKLNRVLSPSPSPPTSPQPTPTPVPTPTPTPNWKESDEAKQLATQLTNEVEKLIDEANVIDLSDIDKAIKVYNDWVEKCSVELGRIDSRIRRFGQNTSYKFEWDKTDRSVRKVKYLDATEQRRNLKLELNVSILTLDAITSEIRIATLPGLPRGQPAKVPPSVAFLYRDKQIQIHNLSDAELYLWGTKLGTSPAKMEDEPRVVSPQPFFYHIYGFDELAFRQMPEGSESRTIYYLFVEDRLKQKFTLRCLLWARVKDRQLSVETQNLGTVEGWVNQ